MKTISKLLIKALMIAPFGTLFAAGGSSVPLEHLNIDRNNTASMQRGAKHFMENCSGCHSLKYARYADVARDIKIVDAKGQPHKEFIQKYLNFVNDDFRSPIINALDPLDAQVWFGKAPPDLSLTVRSRGSDWIYTYLKTYYNDPSRTWGVNNVVYPDVGMPHVLSHLQPKNHPVYDEENHVIGVAYDSDVAKSDILAYEKVLSDIVHFLDYISEPTKKQRLDLGVYVMLGLFVFAAFSYLNYKQLWKDIK